MPARLPSKDDGIPGNYAIVPAPGGRTPTNILILLHGLGDTHGGFAKFGEKLQLPETACISYGGTSNMPFDVEGYHWGDDVQFDAEGTIDADAGFKKSTKVVLDDLTKSVLVKKCGFEPRNILLFGYGQGGMLALNIAAELGKDAELGGIVSIGGALPSNATSPDIQSKSKTPVLLCHGYRQSAIRDEHIDKLKDTFDYVEVKEWRKSGDGMPSNREEMLPIMSFWARRLKSAAPKGTIEVP